jgi:hypothetical protein
LFYAKNKRIGLSIAARRPLKSVFIENFCILLHCFCTVFNSMAVFFCLMMGDSGFFGRWDGFLGNVLTLGLVWLILGRLSRSDSQTGEESLWIAAKLLVKV